MLIGSLSSLHSRISSIRFAIYEHLQTLGSWGSTTNSARSEINEAVRRLLLKCKIRYREEKSR